MSAIRAVEQEVRDTEVRFQEAIRQLRPRQPRWDSDAQVYRRPENAVLGNFDGIPVIEVAKDWGGKNDPDILAETATYDDQEYAWATSILPWHTYSTMRRAVKLSGEGVPQVFGITEEGKYMPSEIGIYVPNNELALARRKHADEVLKDYPTVTATLEAIGKLNISPSFVRFIEAKLAHGETILVEPFGKTWRSIPEKKGFGYWERGTNFTIAGKESQHCKVLSFQRIAKALEQLEKPANGSYEVTFHRLSDMLKELVNIPLGNAYPAPIVTSYVLRDFESDQMPADWKYLSISIF